MSKGGKKHIGAGAHGKGAGTGANTEIPKEKIGENMCSPTATKLSTPTSAAWTASIFRPSNSRITPQIASRMTKPNKTGWLVEVGRSEVAR